MAQQLQNISLSSPGFGGINTQDSPLLQNLAFAAISDNVVIDKAGRIAARKGYELVSTNGASVLGTSTGIEHISEFVQQNGSKVLFTAGNGKLFTGTTTLTEVTPAAYTVTANDWSACTIGNKHYLFQRDHAPLVYDPSTSALTLVTAHAAAQGTPPHAHICLGAYGRVWAADVTGDKKTVYWSDLLDGVDWNSGSSGSLDLSNVWPTGTDEIVALEAHNDFLIIFGKQSILFYAGANDPANMTLNDFVIGIGSVSRDSVVNIGTDVIYVDRSGVRSIGRTIQEKSSRIGDISRNVSQEIKNFIATETAAINCVFDPNNAFLLVIFPNLETVYCFDTRFPLSDGSYRATTWSSIKPLCGFVNFDEELLLGVGGGYVKYSTNRDNGYKYMLSYFSNPLDFGDSSRLKFLKAINVTTFEGSLARVVLQWAYDYTQDFTKTAFNLKENNTGQYNIDEYNTTAEYGSSAVLTNTQRVNASGSGQVVQIGLETVVDGQPIAIQQLNVQSLVGRML